MVLKAHPRPNATASDSDRYTFKVPSHHTVVASLVFCSPVSQLFPLRTGPFRVLRLTDFKGNLPLRFEKCSSMKTVE